jgi:hypothetical protein
LSGTLQSPTWPFKSKLLLALRAALGAPKDAVLGDVPVEQCAETKPSNPIIALNSSAAPFTDERTD